MYAQFFVPMNENYVTIKFLLKKFHLRKFHQENSTNGQFHPWTMTITRKMKIGKIWNLIFLLNFSDGIFLRGIPLPPKIRLILMQAHIFFVWWANKIATVSKWSANKICNKKPNNISSYLWKFEALTQHFLVQYWSKLTKLLRQKNTTENNNMKNNNTRCIIYASNIDDKFRMSSNSWR